MTEAAASVQGSGWALASWERAYYLQYENRKTDFFDAIWNVVNWADTQRRFEAARAADTVLA